MGMYDTIEDIQVKCFDYPYYVREDDIFGSGISYSGGGLKYFKKGDTVPYKRMWYDYTPNFGILNHFFQFESVDSLDEAFIIIKNGKVKKVICGIDNVKDSDFKGLNKVIDHNGSIINVSSTSDISKMRDDFKTYRNIYDKVNKEASKLLKEWTSLAQMKNGIIPLAEGIVKEDLEEKIKKTQESYEKERDIVDKEISRLSKTYIAPWFLENEWDDYSTLGAAFECKKNLTYRASKKITETSTDYEIKSKEDAIEDYYSLLGMMKTIAEDKKVVEGFFSWQSFSSEIEKEYREELERIREGKEELPKEED